MIEEGATLKHMERRTGSKSSLFDGEYRGKRKSETCSGRRNTAIEDNGEAINSTNNLRQWDAWLNNMSRLS